MIANYGFNTFVTQDWLPLCEVLIDSILKFSKYGITINCINCDYQYNNDKVFIKRINISDPSFFAICSAKWFSLLNNTYDICAMLDVDMIATKNIDLLFEDNKEKIVNSKFPLFAKHPHNPFKNSEYHEYIDNLCKVFSENKPKMKWVYACGLIGNHHKWFIEEITDALRYLYGHKITPYAEDEGILNALLTKYQVDYDIGYNYIPNFSLIRDYITNTISTELQESYLQYDCPVKFYILHGCKDPILARQMLNEIIHI